MSVLSSVRSVLWARRRQPEDVRYLAALAHERFGPEELLRQAVEAEEAGFDGVCGSDHLAPWWTDRRAPTVSDHRRGEDEVSDSSFTKQIIASADPDTHVKRIKRLQGLGATTIVLMNVSANNPEEALRIYGRDVLPTLRET